MFTVAMATFRDSTRAKFTAMGLLAHHPLCGEVLFVDNDPGGPESAALEALAAANPKIRYVPLAWPKGTSPPRDLAVREAAFGRVVVLDSHVVVQPGSLEALASAMDRPGCGDDLYHGPMVNEGLGVHSTHLNDQWGAGMWGKWGRAFRSPDGTPFSPVTPDDGATIGFVHLNSQSLVYTAAGVDAVAGWPGHEAKLLDLGCAELADGPDPFEIPGHGLGLFATTKAGWLGFHPDARGFGGEEMTVHAKYRQAGRTVWCVPRLRWWHDFGRAGVPYPNGSWHMVRNYVLNFTALGLDLAPLYKHYVADPAPGKKFPESEWDQLVAGADWPAMTAAITPGTLAPLDPTLPPPAVPCRPCNPPPPDLTTLEGVYAHACRTPGDINEHLPTLAALVATAPRVVEMGTRWAVSTVAFLAGGPVMLHTYDLNASPQAEQLKAVAGDCDYRVFQGDSETVDIAACDLLFLDTDPHTAARVSAELAKHAGKVERYIVLHDTVTFGEDYGGKPGVMVAVRQFLRENPGWTAVRHDKNNNGLMVLSRAEADKVKPPGALRQALNFAKAVTRHALNGSAPASDEVFAARVELCVVCPLRYADQCGECGCPVEKKASWESEACPRGKWGVPA